MVSLTALVVVSSMLAGQAEAKTAMPADVRQQIEERFIGEVVFQGTYGEQKFTGVESWRWANDKLTLIIEGVVVIEGQKFSYTSLAGWEAATKSLVVTGFFEGGDSATTRWTEFSPSGWKGQIKGLFEGQAYESPAKIEFSKDVIRYEDTTLGKPWKSEGRRSIPDEQSDGQKAYSAYAELAVGGTWIAEIDGQRFEDTYELILGGKFLLLTSKGSGDFPGGVSIGGLDSVMKKCTFWGFDAEGGVSIGTNKLAATGVWVGEAKGAGPSGGFHQTTRLTRIDADTVKYEILEQTVSGEVKPFPNVTTWKRKR